MFDTKNQTKKNSSKDTKEDKAASPNPVIMPSKKTILLKNSYPLNDSDIICRELMQKVINNSQDKSSIELKGLEPSKSIPFLRNS